ncbi:MAG: vitamin K epoxide reductase family protein [Bacteroidota bacterium]
MKKTLARLVYAYLKDNQYHLDRQEWQLQLKAHPDYPSLRAITDTMDFFGVEHIAAVVPKESLEELPDRFLAIVQAPGQPQELAWVKQEGPTLFVETETQQGQLSKGEFLESWEGLVLAVDKNERPSLTNPQKSQLLYLAAILLLFFSLASRSPDQVHLLYTLLSFLGLGLAITIIRTQLGHQSDLINRFCSSGGEQNSCTAVLASRGAVIAGIPLSDLALVYFMSTSAVLCFAPFHYGLFFCLGISSGPIILYSLLYQWRVLKQWCTLCLGLVAVLSTQLVLLLVFRQPLTMPELEVFGHLGASVALAALFWYLVKPLLHQQQRLAAVSLQLARFKRNPTIFEFLLSQEPQAGSAANDALLLGNPESAFRLQVITNPLCSYCKAAFESYQKILQRYGDRLCLELHFNIFLDDPQDVSRRIALQATEVYRARGWEAFVGAMADWFAHYDLERWRSRWGLEEQAAHLARLKSHKQWCLQQDINFTPATLIQRQLLPQSYELEDLLFLLEDLIGEEVPQAEYALRLPEAG